MPLHYRLEDLPERFRKQAEDALRPKPRTRPSHEPAPAAPPHSPVPTSTSTPTPTPTPTPTERDYSPSTIEKPPVRDFHGSPNKTESDYNSSVLHGLGRYEAITLRLPGGNYTPDWMTIDDGIVTLHEVKGSYRFGSESRAILAFREAAALFPFWRFVWAQKQKGGKWSVKHLLNAASPASSSSSASSTVPATHPPSLSTPVQRI